MIKFFIHLYSDLHAVEPNSDTFSVLYDVHCGHLTAFAGERLKLSASLGCGGEIPNSSIFFLPFSEIQSELHGGENDFSIMADIPIFFNSLAIFSSMTEIAGHPI